jgi:hypothetical protein
LEKQKSFGFVSDRPLDMLGYGNGVATKLQKEGKNSRERLISLVSTETASVV